MSFLPAMMAALYKSGDASHDQHTKYNGSVGAENESK